MVRLKGITKRRVTLSLDEELYKELRDLNLNISGIANNLLKNYLEKYKISNK
nr:MAG TPA: Post-segregation antitoxin CcdA [Caudoviricetes sp.]